MLSAVNRQLIQRIDDIMDPGYPSPLPMNAVTGAALE
jgi:hypothetical protein